MKNLWQNVLFSFSFYFLGRGNNNVCIDEQIRTVLRPPPIWREISWDLENRNVLFTSPYWKVDKYRYVYLSGHQLLPVRNIVRQVAPAFDAPLLLHTFICVWSTTKEETNRQTDRQTDRQAGRQAGTEERRFRKFSTRICSFPATSSNDRKFPLKVDDGSL